ncbi:MAG: hypothetical protein Unbinned4834contig1000_1 [Prokaryotic dsDNA virus sp.]|nr:MAG: hypothetical protein Unbinned4834contig1000_1 [Prokaryotic dsDNA virus sp.]|tara:strand:- start:1334 stop:2785 length:1452 start_codon:yes stop_codon:yes gene_type:complete
MKTIGDTLPRRFKAKASGSITAGKPLIVETDGDVAQVGETSITASEGSQVTFETGGIQYLSAAYDKSADRVVAVYRDTNNSSYPTAAIGTVSGTSISFGTPVVVASVTTGRTFVVYDENAGKVLVGYVNNSVDSYGYGVVGTVSGTTISFGTAVAYSNHWVDYHTASYDSDAQKIVIASEDDQNSDVGKAYVATISGTSVSFGSATQFESGAVSYLSAAYDPTNQKTIIAYRDEGNSNNGTAVVGTVSGTSISFGTPVVFTTGHAHDVAIGYDPASTKMLIVYRDGDDANYGLGVVGTVSGDSISFGTPVTYLFRNPSTSGVVFHTAGNQLFVTFSDQNNSNKGRAVPATISGTAVSYGTMVYISDHNVSVDLIPLYDPDTKQLALVYRAGGDGDKGKSNIYRPAYDETNLTSENYIGIAEYAAADTETATVLIKGGVSTTQSSLTPGQTYFVQGDGTIGTSAGDPSVTAGTAVTSTKLIVKG